MSQHRSPKEQRFVDIVNDHEQLIRKICFMYADDVDHFHDLYQESLITLWQGIDSFEGRSKLSTWIYRACINTCISSRRRVSRHSVGRRSLDSIVDLPVDDDSTVDNLHQMYDMIANLRDIDKSIILMWLDEMSYDEIAAVTGLGRNNIASRLRRIKMQLAKNAQS